MNKIRLQLGLERWGKNKTKRGPGRIHAAQLPLPQAIKPPAIPGKQLSKAGPSRVDVWGLCLPRPSRPRGNGRHWSGQAELWPTGNPGLNTLTLRADAGRAGVAGVCVCLWAYVCAGVHGYVCVSVHPRVHVCCVHVCRCACMHVYTCTHV